MTEPARKEKPPEKPARKPRAPYPKLPEASEDPEAKRLCAVILEVLGGARTPTDAAGALGVSVPRYYAIEAKALRGLLRACQRRPRGRRRTAESELAQFKGDIERLTKERDRLQALLRVSQRAMGVPAPAKPARTAKRRRRPQVRALRASRSLSSAPGENSLAKPPEPVEDAVAVKG